MEQKSKIKTLIDGQTNLTDARFQTIDWNINVTDSVKSAYKDDQCELYVAFIIIYKIVFFSLVIDFWNILWVD